MNISAIKNKMRSLDRLFLFSVVLPVILSVIYFGAIASDVYVSESRFIVRSPDKPAMSGIGFLLKGAGFSSSGEELNAAQDYLKSRDALRALNTGDAFRKAYGDRSISFFDRFNSFGYAKSFEDLYTYYENKVDTDLDRNSSIITLTVRAYTASDARRFNEQLLEMAEATVNRLNERARNDLIKVSTDEVAIAKKKAESTAIALAIFRNKSGIVDPEKQAPVQLQMIFKLQDQLIASRAQLAQMKAIAPQNPQIEVIQAQISSISHDIDTEMGKIAGGSKSLSSAALQYQRLFLESQFADRHLTAAMASLQEAQNEARRKHAYVERIVQPSLPDDAIEPRRWRGIASTLIFSLIAWAVLTMLLAGVREHQQ